MSIAAQHAICAKNGLYSEPCRDHRGYLMSKLERANLPSMVNFLFDIGFQRDSEPPDDIVGRVTFPRWMQRTAIVGLTLFAGGFVFLWPISFFFPVSARLLPLGVMIVGGVILYGMAIEARRYLTTGSEIPLT